MADTHADVPVFSACPLCRADTSVLVETFSASDLIAQWQRALQVDVANEFAGVSHLDLRHCLRCGLCFFVPPAAGSSRLYEQLQEKDWYYLRGKWEHGVAALDIGEGARVLEVGCGRGVFLDRIRRERNACATGIELNAEAAAEAARAGLAVSTKDLFEVSVEKKGVFDAVCAFHVLEHATHAHTFVSQCVGALKEGGTLILTVPNQKSFVGLSRDNLFDMPPHHVSRWHPDTMRYLERIFPLALKRMRYEPLPEHHLRWYLNLKMEQWPWIPYVTGPAVIATRRWIAPLLRRTRLYRLFRGQTLYCRFRKR